MTTTQRVERRTYVKADSRIVWGTLHDPAAQDVLYPELRLGPAAPSWPAAGATRSARLRFGLLRASVREESLEARPESRFRTVLVGDGIRLERAWTLEPGAGGGTRVLATADLVTTGRWVGRLIRLGRGSAPALVETNLRILKEMAEGGGR
ncbi:MAG: SRPBCC family protein [Chloroflexi bacterium]|nr:SRPBCC family protein [Chloroflexota bacterium]